MIGSGKGWFAGASEHFTHRGTIQYSGGIVANPSAQFLDSSVTRLTVGYQTKNDLGIQIALPFIRNTFRRVSAPSGVSEAGSETGVGDLSIASRWIPIRSKLGGGTFHWHLQGGLKLPTGDAGRLAQRQALLIPAGGGGGGGGLSIGANSGTRGDFGRIPAGTGSLRLDSLPAVIPTHDGHDHDPISPGAAGAIGVGGAFGAIHGQDLALGSGSVDGVVGTGFNLTWKRGYVGGGIQYTIRTEGSYGYRFADVVDWWFAPGMTLLSK